MVKRISTTPSTWEILNSDEVIDTRNIINRMNDMRNEHTTWHGEEESPIPLGDWPADARAEYETLAAIIEAVETGCTWGNPNSGECIALVRHSYFTEYVREEYAELHCGDGLYAVPEGEIYSLPKPVKWERLVRELPQLDFVDWEAVAQHDRRYYAEVEYCGVPYLFAI